MQKTNVQPLQEVLASHVNTLGDYVENALQLLSSTFLRVTDGVLGGYDFTSGGVANYTLGSGAIILNGIIGQQEAPSARVMASLPVSGTRTDLICVSYLEVEDTPVSSYTLLDISTRTETITSINSRRFGSSPVAVFSNTTAPFVPAGYIPLWEVVVNSVGIVSYSDVRQQARVTRIDEDLGTNFKLAFYSAF